MGEKLSEHSNLDGPDLLADVVVLDQPAALRVECIIGEMPSYGSSSLGIVVGGRDSGSLNILLGQRRDMPQGTSCLAIVDEERPTRSLKSLMRSDPRAA